jgi:hypothetical protein
LLGLHLLKIIRQNKYHSWSKPTTFAPKIELRTNSKKLGFELSFDYVQSLRSEIGRSTRSELLTLEKDHYVLIQSLFLDRKDELQEMQKVLWHIVDISKTNADIQIKATEKLQDLTMILVGLYHTLP